MSLEKQSSRGFKGEATNQAIKTKIKLSLPLNSREIF